MESLTKKFYELFKGFSNAHGQTELIDSKKHGKQMSKSYMVREPLSLDLVQQHLDGKKGIGSIPIDENNQCRFGVLDIDEYNLDLQGLAKKIKKLKLPLTLCRSKSGGAHLYIFLSEPISATEIRDRLAEFASALGYGNCETFPKQEEVIVERGDVGNFINLPYFDAEQTLRYAIRKDGEPASLEEFLELVDERSVLPDEFVGLTFGKQVDEFKDWAPCLGCMFGQGIPKALATQLCLQQPWGVKKSSPKTGS